MFVELLQDGVALRASDDMVSNLLECGLVEISDRKGSQLVMVRADVGGHAWAPILENRMNIAHNDSLYSNAESLHGHSQVTAIQELSDIVKWLSIEVKASIVAMVQGGTEW